MRAYNSLCKNCAALFVGTFLTVALFLAPAAARCQSTNASSYSFIVAGDMRGFTNSPTPGKRFFDGACEAIRDIGPGAFMLSPGDCDPVADIRATMDQFLGSNYLWYVVAGNHDADTPANMTWLRHWAQTGIAGLVRRGPTNAEDTIFSFDYANSHFVALNYYYNGKSDHVGKGELPDATLQWLEQDLTATHQPLIWVSGHKPLKALPDTDNGRIRHGDDPISPDPARVARMEALLKEHHVRAYICGHTHDTSVAQVDGIWQADSGHARGGGDPGAASTFLKFRVEGLRTWVDIYRADANGLHYRMRDTVEIK